MVDKLDRQGSVVVLGDLHDVPMAAGGLGQSHDDVSGVWWEWLLAHIVSNVVGCVTMNTHPDKVVKEKD